MINKIMNFIIGVVLFATLLGVVWQIPRGEIPRVVESFIVLGVPVIATILFWNKNRFLSYGIVVGLLLFFGFALLLTLGPSSEIGLKLF